MSWANPWMLFALLLPAAAAWRVGRTRLHSKPLWPAMSRVSIGSNGSVRVARPRKSDPAYLIMAAVALGVIALARPQWGEQPGQSFSQSIEVMIALDLSRSMWTQDMPNQTARLRAAKATVERLLDGLRGENVGLVVFAGTSFVQVPMSPDYQIVREFLPSLDPNYMPVGGTDYDRMLGSALEGFSQANDRDRYLIVLSDGENTKPGLEPRIPELLRRSVHVIGIGFGTEQGASIPDQKGGQLRDKDKNPIVSRLTPASLQDLATRTEGQYAAATTLSDAADLRKLIKDTVESGRAGRARNANAAVGVERFQWFLVPAVLLSLLSLVREFRRHPRPRAVHRAATTESTTAERTATAATPAAGMADTTAGIAAAAGAALTMLVCVLAPPRVQAHHNSEAGFEVKEDFKGDPALRMRAIASHMGKFGYDPLDLKLMVEAAMQFAISERAPRQVAAGRRDARCRRGHAHGEEAGSETGAVGSLRSGDPRPDGAAARGGEGEGPGVQRSGRRGRGRRAELQGRAVAQGQGQGGQGSVRQEYEEPVGVRAGRSLGRRGRSRRRSLMGGRRGTPRPPQNPALTPAATPADDPTMAEARKNFAIVVKADSPGRVHQLLNGDARRAGRAGLVSAMMPPAVHLSPLGLDSGGATPWDFSPIWFVLLSVVLPAVLWAALAWRRALEEDPYRLRRAGSRELRRLLTRLQRGGGTPLPVDLHAWFQAAARTWGVRGHSAHGEPVVADVVILATGQRAASRSRAESSAVRATIGR
ncbi:MAG: VWA domain-containing protein [Gammaproteobacteria bacterium]